MANHFGSWAGRPNGAPEDPIRCAPPQTRARAWDAGVAAARSWADANTAMPLEVREDAVAAFLLAAAVELEPFKEGDWD